MKKIRNRTKLSFILKENKFEKISIWAKKNNFIIIKKYNNTTIVYQQKPKKNNLGSLALLKIYLNIEKFENLFFYQFEICIETRFILNIFIISFALIGISIHTLLFKNLISTLYLMLSLLLLLIFKPKETGIHSNGYMFINDRKKAREMLNQLLKDLGQKPIE